MADIAPKLVELSAEKLRALHERLHKSEATPATIEVHHLATVEMLRRGLEPVQNDDWDSYEILIDTMKNANLDSMGSSLPADMVADVVKETGSNLANVQLFLTSSGYEMRLEAVKKEIPKPEVIKAEGYSPPKAVRTAARRALDWIGEGKAGSGFTGVGRARASQLASGESISLDTLKRMKSFFSRHEVDKNALGFSQGEKGYPSAGRVAWDAWGGDAGFAWAESIVAESEKEVAKHNQGLHDQKTHGKWADNIADAVNAGEHPSIEAENVTAFLMGAAKRTDHPDLTELKVNGTMLFGDEGMGIARKDMPQIPSERRGEFLADLAKEGVSVDEESIDPKTLKPIQKEVSSSRSGAIYNRYKEQGGIPQEQRILISKDGFVIDGHHTWGAAVGFSFDNPNAKLPVYRLSLTAQEALDRSLAWTKEQGIEGQAIDAPAKKSLAWRPLTKHDGGGHDQSTHGSWAESGSPKLTIMGKNDGTNEFLNEDTRVVRYQPEGEEPKDYILYLEGVKGSTIWAVEKPTDGTTLNGWGPSPVKGIVGKIDVLGPGNGSLARTSAKNDNFSTIFEAIIKPAHQRRGLASAMLQFHRDKFPEQNLQHSDVLSGDGKAWSDVAKHGEHDQKTHGSWATGGVEIPPMASDVAPLPQWSAEAVAEAKRLREKALAVEPVVTKLMVDLQKISGGEFVQLDHRIKSTNSLARKIDSEAVAEFDGDRSRAADAVSDAVRYTLKVGDENYTDALTNTVAALESSGFKLRVKNFWQSGDPYDGVNIKAKKDGVEVEIQLHTPSSFSHKEGEGGTHRIYEKYQIELNDNTRQSMWNQMIDIAKGVSKPAGYTTLLGTGTLILQQFQTAQEAGLLKSTPVDKLPLMRGNNQ
jgi:ribosomal protein S18 acetylase RimI-like enzyme